MAVARLRVVRFFRPFFEQREAEVPLDNQKLSEPIHPKSPLLYRETLAFLIAYGFPFHEKFSGIGHF